MEPEQNKAPESSKSCHGLEIPESEYTHTHTSGDTYESNSMENREKCPCGESAKSIGESKLGEKLLTAPHSTFNSSENDEKTVLHWHSLPCKTEEQSSDNLEANTLRYIMKPKTSSPRPLFDEVQTGEKALPCIGVVSSLKQQICSKYEAITSLQRDSRNGTNTSAGGDKNRCNMYTGECYDTTSNSPEPDCRNYLSVPGESVEAKAPSQSRGIKHQLSPPANVRLQDGRYDCDSEGWSPLKKETKLVRINLDAQMLQEPLTALNTTNPEPPCDDTIRPVTAPELSPRIKVTPCLPFSSRKPCVDRVPTVLNQFLPKEMSLLKPLKKDTRPQQAYDDVLGSKSLNTKAGGSTSLISRIGLDKYMQPSRSHAVYHLELSISAETTLTQCEQKMPVPMDLFFNGLLDAEKVGEGVFGEVYSGRFFGSKEHRVYKIVAIEGHELVNGEKQKNFGEILPEIIISKQLSKVQEGFNKCCTDCFVKMHNACITFGSYPESLKTAWKSWDTINKSDNDCPDFLDKQLYTVFVYDHGGYDMEGFKFDTARQAFFVVLQVAHALAVGESSMELEHRDLHWGNVLVKNTRSELINFRFNEKTLSVPSCGAQACIIDFTISRISDESGLPVYLDMKDDDEQFLGTGDHQFNIYRMMRDINRNEWATFRPKTNVFWIHYLAEKIFIAGRYKETNSPIHDKYMQQLSQLKDIVMEYSSCIDFVSSKKCEQYINAASQDH